MHFGQILGIERNPQLDKFITVYGIEPDGAVLSHQTLSDLFSPYMPDFQKLSNEARRGNEEARRKLMDGVGKQLVFDGKDTSGSAGGLIKVKVKNTDPPPPETYYPLFQLGVRSRGIGAPPTFELVQHNFFANVLESGVDIKKWPKMKRMNFYKTQIKTLEEDIKRNGKHASTHAQTERDLEELKQRLQGMLAKKKK
jgi:hypothetical protein